MPLRSDEYTTITRHRQPGRKQHGMDTTSGEHRPGRGNTGTLADVFAEALARVWQGSMQGTGAAGAKAVERFAAAEDSALTKVCA